MAKANIRSRRVIRFRRREEARLEWYFEQHLRFPFTDQVEAQAAAASVTAYGEALFKHVFADADAYARYKEALQSGVEQYVAQLKEQPALTHLPFDRWAEVLREAVNWGLISPKDSRQAK